MSLLQEHVLQVDVQDSQRRNAPFDRIRIETSSGPICYITYDPKKKDPYLIQYRLKDECKFITLVLMDSTGEQSVNISPDSSRYVFTSRLAGKDVPQSEQGENTLSEETKPYRILSLSGGGVRGIFQAQYLSEVAKTLPKPFYTNFDLIAGTSTGALLAIGIALEVDLGRLLDIYKYLSPKIFTPEHRMFPWGPFRRGPKFLNQDLRKILTNVFENRRLEACKVPIVIPATVLDRYGHRIFTTLLRNRSPIPDNDSHLNAVDVAMASAAAPTYFQAVRPAGGERTYVDGGMWANNPALVAVIEAHKWMRIPFEQMRLVSVGNGEVPEGMLPAEYESKRVLQMIGPIFDLMFSSQATAADDFVESLIGSANMLRVNTSLKEEIRLYDFDTAINKLSPEAERMVHETGHKLQQLIQL